MSDESDSPATEAMPAPAAVAPAPVQLAGDPPPTAPPPAPEPTFPAASEAGSDRPELIVAGAFAAGFIIAMILKRLGQ